MNKLKQLYNRILKLNSHQKTICFDFDGVIASYDKGFQGEDVFGDPNAETIKAIQSLKRKGIKIIIFTTRLATPKLIEYLKTNNVPYDEINKNSDNPKDTSCKPIADCYVDDRAVNYHGQSSDDLLKTINSFLK